MEGQYRPLSPPRSEFEWHSRRVCVWSFTQNQAVQARKEPKRVLFQMKPAGEVFQSAAGKGPAFWR